jgi:hypothetical protein
LAFYPEFEIFVEIKGAKRDEVKRDWKNGENYTVTYI